MTADGVVMGLGEIAFAVGAISVVRAGVTGAATGEACDNGGRKCTGNRRLSAGEVS